MLYGNIHWVKKITSKKRNKLLKSLIKMLSFGDSALYELRDPKACWGLFVDCVVSHWSLFACKFSWVMLLWYFAT
ncbi:Uncharacterized protein TCM_036884 [Theobroma cacao]|uniref:Uncharacterized protein n=1 Tax=Theobroma cacao TaxID=3641 RepID=A0A061GHH5_THECC|nr:Uncharacterized protein TCM_036884 [Theobroma cacao]